MAEDQRAGVMALMPAAAVAGLVLALIADLHRGSGIDHTPGAHLVVISCALLAAAGTALGLARDLPIWLRRLLLVLCLLDIAGSAAAAGFLHAWLLLAAMAVALVGWGLIAGAPPTARRIGVGG